MHFFKLLHISYRITHLNGSINETRDFNTYLSFLLIKVVNDNTNEEVEGKE